MSQPPFRVYGCAWIVFCLIFGGIAWLIWRTPWISISAGVVLGFVGLVAAVAIGGGRTRTPGPRDPDDPRL